MGMTRTWTSRSSWQPPAAIAMVSSALPRCLLQQVRHSVPKRRQIMLQDVPDDTGVDRGVSVDEQVAKVDDLSVLRDTLGDLWSEPRQLSHRLADDLELPLDAGSQERALLIVAEALACGELS